MSSAHPVRAAGPGRGPGEPEPRELVLAANARMPSQRAQSLQVIQAAAAFARAGAPTTLLHARRRGTPVPTDPGALFDHYAVPAGPRPEVRAVGCIDWIDLLPRTLQYAPARLQELSFARNAARELERRHPRGWILTRELEVARRLARAGRAGVFLELHRVPGGRLRRGWLAEAARGAAGIVAISGGVRADLLELGLDPAGILVEHDAYDPARFEGAPGRVEARARLGLPPEASVVVYTGGLLAWKGVDVLVEAARRCPGVLFVIAGGMDADVARIAARARGLGNVRLEGFRPPREVPLYLAAADVAVAPNRSQPAISARYTSPLKVFECMAAGVALVASDLPSLRELLEHGRDAWLVAPDDPAALTEGLARVLADQPLRRSLAAGLAARAPVHTFDARARRILAWMAERAGPARASATASGALPRVAGSTAGRTAPAP